MLLATFAVWLLAVGPGVALAPARRPERFVCRLRAERDGDVDHSAPAAARAADRALAAAFGLDAGRYANVLAAPGVRLVATAGTSSALDALTGGGLGLAPANATLLLDLGAVYGFDAASRRFRRLGAFGALGAPPAGGALDAAATPLLRVHTAPVRYAATCPK